MPGVYSAAVPASHQQPITQLWVNGQRRLPGRSPVMVYNHTDPNNPAQYIVANPGQINPALGNAPVCIVGWDKIRNIA